MTVGSELSFFAGTIFGLENWFSNNWTCNGKPYQACVFVNNGIHCNITDIAISPRAPQPRFHSLTSARTLTHSLTHSLTSLKDASVLAFRVSNVTLYLSTFAPFSSTNNCANPFPPGVKPLTAKREPEVCTRVWSSNVIESREVSDTCDVTTKESLLAHADGTWISVG